MGRPGIDHLDRDIVRDRVAGGQRNLVAAVEIAVRVEHRIGGATGERRRKHSCERDFI
jgi:hypothetical protein